MGIEDRKTRILTTHAGSLPRPDDVWRFFSPKWLGGLTTPPHSRLLRARQSGPLSKGKLISGSISSATASSRSRAFRSMVERLSGLEPLKSRTGRRRTRENAAFPSFYKNGAHSGTQPQAFACTGPITYLRNTILQADLNNLKMALSGVSTVDVFVPSVSPSSCAGLMENHYYKSDEEHLFAVAEAMRYMSMRPSSPLVSRSKSTTRGWPCTICLIPTRRLEKPEPG